MRTSIAVVARWLVPSLVILAGCAGSHPPLAELRTEFDRYNRDARALGPQGTAGRALRVAQEEFAAADSLARHGRSGPGASRMSGAVADVRAALALAEMAEAESRADRCAAAAAEARRAWDEALRGLLQAEQVARRTAEGVPRQAPDPSAIAPPGWPASTVEDTDGLRPDPARALTAWGEWLAEARARRVATADLESRFEARRRDREKGKAEKRSLALHEAGRLTQELEARVRRTAAAEKCARSAAMAAELGEARDAALRGTLELERGLQDALRQRLEQVRAEAQTRQDQLYDAMRSLEGKYASIRRDARGTIVSLADILFDFNKATLRREVEFALVRVATILNQFPEMTVRIEGHTDNVGTEEYNLELSRRRSQAVQEFLASQQVAAERMTSEGYGMSRPVADNTTAEGRQKNRRVDLVIEETP